MVVTEVASVMKEEWSCSGGGQLNAETMMLQRRSF